MPPYRLERSNSLTVCCNTDGIEYVETGRSKSVSNYQRKATHARKRLSVLPCVKDQGVTYTYNRIRVLGHDGPRWAGANNSRTARQATVRLGPAIHSHGAVSCLDPSKSRKSSISNESSPGTAAEDPCDVNLDPDDP